MIGATLCSGIGGPEAAAPWVDWRFASEIGPFPRAVLAKRFGYRPPGEHNPGDPLLWGDMGTVTPDLWPAHGIPLPDLIVAGTPCQAFSVAGQRQGLKDDRGNLTLKFVDIVHDIAAARPDRKLVVLWENVPGVLSDKSNAFGCFLGAIVGASDAFTTPDRKSWPSTGMVEGPRARAAWRVLDAQYFGVAQRRRRVFVVVDFGNAVDPAKVLLEPESLRGNSPPRRETGEGFARGFETGPHGGRFTEVAPTLDTSCKDGPVRAQIGAGAITARMTAIGEYSDDDTASSLKARDYKGATDLVAHALRGEGFDASEDGTGRGTPLVPVAFDCKGSELQHDTVAPPLRAMGHAGSHANGGGHAAVAIAENQRGELRISHAIPALGHGGGKPGQGYPAVAIQEPAASEIFCAVRRLTPVECARLQGFPDDHTVITYHGKPAADGPQYKALGNSMAVPCVRWILDRVRAGILLQHQIAAE